MKRACQFTVVDDDEHTLFFVVRALAAAFPTAEIKTFHDGAEAFAFLKSHPSDCLITDQSMTCMNGDELIHALREAGVEVPALMVSNSPHAQLAADSAGVRLINKGKIAKDLKSAVTALVGNGCASRAA